MLVLGIKRDGLISLKKLWETKKHNNNNKLKYIIPGIIVLVGGLFMSIGASSGEVAVVFTKAINICLECIGIG